MHRFKSGFDAAEIRLEAAVGQGKRNGIEIRLQTGLKQQAFVDAFHQSGILFVGHGSHFAEGGFVIHTHK